MKTPYWIFGLIFLVLALLVLAPVGFGFTTYDYGSECTRCLRDYHVVEKRFCGLTYSKTETLQFPGNDLTDIDGTPCQHIYRTTGFGRQTGVMIADGITAEGQFFQYRQTALRAAFDLYTRIPNRDLMRETLALNDSCLPPYVTMEFFYDPKSAKRVYAFALANALEKVGSEQDWRAALDNVKSEIAADKTISAK